MTNAPFPPGSGGAPPTSSYSGPSISSMPRRSSYASVVSGVAPSPLIQSPFSLSNIGMDPSTALAFSSPAHYRPERTASNTRLPRHSSVLDAEMQMNHGGGTTTAWRGAGNALPAYSRQFSQHPGYESFYSATSADDDFFTPSYLRNSRYIARLEAAHRSRLAAQPESASNPPLSASQHRIAPSHRGMTYDIIEKEPSHETDNVMPLPSRWNESDKHAGLELLNDGLEVRYMGPPNKHDHEAAAVRTDYPMPPQCGIYYFEITILSKSKEGMIGIGFSSSKASVERLPGWELESWAYHGDDGKSFFGESQGQGRPYGPTFTVNDIIGCGVNFSTGCAFFTKNGVFLGNAFRELRNVKLYPSVGMKKQPNVHISVNFGQQPFMFDIDGMVKKEKLAIQAEISATSATSLQPPLDENALIQELVAQFLAHDGYVETARAFTEEVRQESQALQNGRTEQLKQYAPEEDLDAANRQKIRAAILDGDIDKALKHTNAYYANVLQDNPHILFKLRCRKFIEMMRRCNEISIAHSKRSRSANGHDDSVFDQYMDVDDQAADDTDGMDTEESDSVAKFNELLTEAVQYGQQLRMDYPTDERGGDRKLLDDIFSLVAYSDPKSSVHGHYLDAAGRVTVAEELNSAILVSLGKSSSAALERLYQQTEVLVNEISEEGGAGAFINIRDDFLQ